ncbi:Gamma-1-syntrophin [Orchesella cincta]|uniref:Gamma-1-syntrophin n=1 Tax=Orchesella cincta TaxID=48709 RepID=A0A1D2MLX6_ORCCI|nr:Gamma-1-syntrophin [Orchesella cincta]
MINGRKITNLDHDQAVEYLNVSTPMVTLKLKYFPTAKPFLSPTQQQNLIESNLSNWDAVEEAAGHNNATTGSGANNTTNTATVANECWETEKSIPLMFALLTRYLGGTDRLRCNAFEVRDATGNSSSGVIHCADAYSLTSWVKCITDVILGLNNVQIKLWMQETGHEIYYVGWVWEGNSEKSGDIAQPWLTWRPKVLAFRGSNLYYMEYPPGVGSDWEGGEIFPVITTLLRVLNSASEHLDERQHCFTLQIATEQSGFHRMALASNPSHST